MKRVLLAGATLLALAVAQPAVAQPMPVFNWTGLYVGGHVGGAWGRTITRGDGVDAFDDNTLDFPLNPSGFVGGLQLGYNWQSGNWVYGIEGDLGYLGLKKSAIDVPNDNFAEVQYGWYGTLTGRIGITFSPTLLYLKGGLAFANIRNTAYDIDGGGVIDPSDFSEVTGTKLGWALGGGLEWAFAPQWSAKIEYLYLDFGSRTSTNLDGDLFTHRNQVQTVKIGLNHRFGH